MADLRSNGISLWRALRSERGRRVTGALAFWGLVAGLLVYNFPYFRALQHANELPRIFLTLAIVEEGSYAIDTYKRDYGYRKAMDVSRSCCLGPRVRGAARRAGWRAPGRDRPRCREHFYSNKAPGMSFLAVPVYGALRVAWRAQGKQPDVRRVRDPRERFERLRTITRWVRLGTAALPALLFMLLLSYWLRGFVPEPHPRRVAVAAYGLGTLAFTYSVQFMSHQLATSSLFAAFVLVYLVGRRSKPWWLLVAAGFLGAFALATDYQLIFAAVPLAVYALWVVRPTHRLAWAVLGAIAPVALLLHYHHDCFGSIFWTGYRFLVAGSDQALHEQGVLGITTPKWDAFRGSFLSADNGLLYFSPWVVVALLGLPLMWRLRRAGEQPRPGRRAWPSAELSFAVAVLFAYTYFILSVSFWRGGWQTGPRYICAMLPALVLPYALVLRRAEGRPWRWALAVAPALVGVVSYALIVTTFPHFPEKFKYPLFDLVGPLLADGYVSYNLGQSRLGLSGTASLVPYFAALALLLLYLAAGPAATSRFVKQSPRRLLAGLLSVVLAVAVLGVYRQAAEAGIRRQWSRPLPRSRETYGQFLRRARRDIRNLWEPKPPGVRARTRRPGRRRPRRRGRRRRLRRR